MNGRPQGNAGASSRAPLVSVIVPTHNRPRLLREALSSLVSQTYGSWEGIVVDNGPAVQVEDVVASFSDHRLRYAFLPEGNRSLARNLGVQLARGSFIAFLDDDDRFLPEYLAKQVAFLLGHADLGLVACGAVTIDGQGNTVHEWPLWNGSPELRLEPCIESCYLMPSVVLLRRSWFEAAGGFDPELPPTEDTDFFLRLMLGGCRMAWQKQFLSEYRVHARNSETQAVAYARNRNRMIEGLLASPNLPARLAQRASEIRASCALQGAAECYIAGAYAEGHRFIARSQVYQPDLTSDAGHKLAEAVVDATGRYHLQDPLQLAQPALTVLYDNDLISKATCRKAWARAAKMSFYQGAGRDQRDQVWRSFVHAARLDPGWLRSRGTWSILLRTLSQRFQNEPQ